MSLPSPSPKARSDEFRPPAGPGRPIPRHNAKPAGKPHARRSARARGYGRRWEQLRIMVLHRDAYTCQRCGREGNEVDHIRPKRAGGQDAMDNLQTLCKPCHSAKTQLEDLK